MWPAGFVPDFAGGQTAHWTCALDMCSSGVPGLVISYAGEERLGRKGSLGVGVVCGMLVAYQLGPGHLSRSCLSCPGSVCVGLKK